MILDNSSLSQLESGNVKTLTNLQFMLGFSQHQLYVMILDNSSLSQLESSVLEENASDSDNDDVMPPAVWATVENMALDH